MSTAHGERHGSFTILLHWVTAILVLIAFIYGPGGSEARVYSAARDAKRQLHETLGMSVLMLSFIRVAWRLVDTRPAEVALARWMAVAAKAAHHLLYLLLFAVPFTAIAGAWLEGHPLTLLAGVTIGPWIAESHAAGTVVAEVHTWLGDAILWVAGAHAAAGLFHHFVLRDGTLRAMLPRWLAGRRS